MTNSDEIEAHRLCDVLRSLHDQVCDDAVKSEALKKAALALSIGYAKGLRVEIEIVYAGIDTPLSEEAKGKLQHMSIILDGSNS